MTAASAGFDFNQLEDAFLSAYERAVASGRQYSLGEIVGRRDIDWRTNEYKPLTVITQGEQQSIKFNDATEGTDNIHVLPSEVEQKMLDMMVAKKMN